MKDPVFLKLLEEKWQTRSLPQASHDILRLLSGKSIRNLFIFGEDTYRLCYRLCTCEMDKECRFCDDTGLFHDFQLLNKLTWSCRRPSLPRQAEAYQCTKSDPGI